MSPKWRNPIKSDDAAGCAATITAIVICTITSIAL
jgi:hypothetical protein